MAVSMRPILLLSLAISLFLPSSAQTCSSYTFSNNKAYTTCNSLPVLSSSLHWTYNAAAGTVDIAYRATQSSDGWIAWGINPTGNQMPGTQALVAYMNASSGAMTAYTTPIADKAPSMQPGKLSFDVAGVEGEYGGGVMTIYATVTLPGNRTTVSHLWQASTVSNGQLQPHALGGANTQSYGSLDLLSGQGSTSGNSLLRRKNTHGILNAVSWGVLMPIGAIIARYLKVFKSADPAWFYLHVTIQCSAYIVGVAGWGTGLKLGDDSQGITYDDHRNIGIALFCLATLQVFALLLRPKKDHKFRLYWNIYHHSIGYTVIILSVVNVFKGLDILDPSQNWKNAYIGIISTLGGIAVVLEAITWVIVLKRKSGSSEKSNHGGNRVNGTNGFGSRQHQVV